MDIETDTLIVGSGHAGAQAAIALRAAQYQGRIALVGDESVLPYERPPLSKDYLLGDKSFDRLLIRQATFWVERNVEIIRGCRITHIDAKAHTAFAADGRSYRYQHLIWATGGRARTLNCPGGQAPGVYTIRHRTDADGLIAALPQVSAAVVIGGGYIGLEAAAVLRKLGKDVTLLEAGPRVLGRVAGGALSKFYEAEHQRQGVDVRLNTQVAAIEVGENQRVQGVRLQSGELLPADIVVVGIGIVPNAEPLLEAGAEGGNGIAVDAYCRSSLPDVYAIGDVALHASLWCEGAPIRIESVQNASDMATSVARTLSGSAEPYRAIPWFWSQQYDLKLQTVGLSTGHDEAVLRGDPAQRSFSVVYLKAGKVIALDCVNAMKDYVQGKALVQAGARLTQSQLADTSVTLKDLVEPVHELVERKVSVA
ncbi:MAG TPA: FAD-dependent oxidoreductase [Comamonas sp.]